jgi:regulator of protease activity HflC (stomatin/prohibitin superfamily)
MVCPRATRGRKDMESVSLISLIVLLIVLSIAARALFRTVPQATVAVVTVFGKYQRIMREGLNFNLPWENVRYR